MTITWKIELTANEICMLRACAAYTDAVAKHKELRKIMDDPDVDKGLNASRALIDQYVLPVITAMRASCLVARGLGEEGLIEPRQGDWRITKRGRMVLAIVEDELRGDK